MILAIITFGTRRNNELDKHETEINAGVLPKAATSASTAAKTFVTRQI